MIMRICNLLNAEHFFKRFIKAYTYVCMYLYVTFFTGDWFSMIFFTNRYMYLLLSSLQLSFSRFWGAIIMKMILDKVHHYLCVIIFFICFPVCIHSHLLCLMFLHYYENESCQVGGWATAHQMHCSLTLFI